MNLQLYETVYFKFEFLLHFEINFPLISCQNFVVTLIYNFCSTKTF